MYSSPHLPPHLSQTVMKFAELASEVQIQRSEPQRLNHLGLPKGRRRANQLFKEVRRKLEDEVGTAAVIQVGGHPRFYYLYMHFIYIFIIFCMSDFLFCQLPCLPSFYPCHLSSLISLLHLSFQGLEVDISPIYALAPEWPSVTCGSGKGLEDVVASLKAYLRRRLASRDRLDLQERSE